MNWKSRWRFVLMLLIWTVLIAAPLAAEACPTCKDSLALNDPARNSLVRGYFWSILFMMSMPFLILGGLGSYFYYEIRKAARGKAALAVVATVPATTAN